MFDPRVPPRSSGRFSGCFTPFRRLLSRLGLGRYDAGSVALLEAVGIQVFPETARERETRAQANARADAFANAVRQQDLAAIQAGLAQCDEVERACSIGWVLNRAPLEVTQTVWPVLAPYLRLEHRLAWVLDTIAHPDLAEAEARLVWLAQATAGQPPLPLLELVRPLGKALHLNRDGLVEPLLSLACPSHDLAPGHAEAAIWELLHLYRPHQRVTYWRAWTTAATRKGWLAWVPGRYPELIALVQEDEQESGSA